MLKINTILFWVLIFICISRGNAQFAPRAGEPGSTALHKDSSVFTAWAFSAQLKRGWMDASDTSLGYTSAGNENSVLGRAGENGTVSLGDGGEIILEFNPPVMNGPGPDFAVFENGFFYQDSFDFLELATVSVSSDGIFFADFPAHAMTQDTLQLLSFEGLDARKIHNLAGKYTFGFGTPFDLNDIIAGSEINLNAIRYIKIKDVIGSIQEGMRTLDVLGNIINDPWPTPFPTGGFDLDAVGVIHQNMQLNTLESYSDSGNIFPNPAAAGKEIYSRRFIAGDYFTISDIQGNNIFESRIQYDGRIILPADLLPAVYILKLNSDVPFKIMIQ